MIPINPHIQTANQVLPADLSAVGRFGKEDEAGACSPGRFAVDSGAAPLETCHEVNDGGGFGYFTNPRRGSSNPDLAATRDIVVLSPPGMMRASHCDSSAEVRTSLKVHCIVGVGLSCIAALRSLVCSWKAPWRARTPTVIEVVIGEGLWVCISVLNFWNMDEALKSGAKGRLGDSM